MGGDGNNHETDIQALNLHLRPIFSLGNTSSQSTKETLEQLFFLCNAWLTQRHFGATAKETVSLNRC